MKAGGAVNGVRIKAPAPPKPRAGGARAALPRGVISPPLRHLALPRPVDSLSSRRYWKLKLPLAVTLAVPVTTAFAFAASVVLHTLGLSVHFAFPSDHRLAKDKPLEVVLVNSKTRARPQDSQALAQANLDGGGNTDEDRRAATPLPVSRQYQQGEQFDSAQQRVRELEKKQRTLIAQTHSSNPTPSQPLAREVQPDAPPTEIAGLDLASSAMAMARLQAQIERNIEEYNKRPRKKFIGARTEEYRFAQYVEDWRSKVERIGTLNYPTAARGKLYGNLVLTVVVRADGSVDNVEINRSSGHPVLDDAARRIVQMAGPYAAFPPSIRRDTDVLEITRTWFFTREEQVRAN